MLENNKPAAVCGLMKLQITWIQKLREAWARLRKFTAHFLLSALTLLLVESPCTLDKSFLPCCILLCSLMARPVQTPPGSSNTILSQAELKGSSASSRLMSDGDCFRAGTLVFPAPFEGLILFVTEIKQISSVSIGCLSAEIARKLRAVYLEGDWMKYRQRSRILST